MIASLPAPVGRDRDLQEFPVWYEVETHTNFDVIVLNYDVSPVSSEGATATFEAPFDLDPAIYSGTIIHGVNAFRETSLHDYTISDVIDGSLRMTLKDTAEYPAGKFARWWITPPPNGSRWYSFSSRIEGRVGVAQKFTLHDDAGVRFTYGPSTTAGGFFTQDVAFTPSGDVNARIESTALTQPNFDYYATLTNAVALYEDLVDPALVDLRPNGTTVTSEEVTAHVEMQDDQSGCSTVTASLYGPSGFLPPTQSGRGCAIAPILRFPY